MAFVALTAAQTDADSPLNETLFDQIRENFDHHALAIDSTTAEIETDKVTQDSIIASAVGQGELKTTTEEVSRISLSLASGQYEFIGTLTNGEYAFQIMGRTSAVAGDDEVGMVIDNFTSTSYRNRVAIWPDVGLSGRDYFARLRYVQASPPNPFGGLGPDWGRWVCAVRDEGTGKILRLWSAGDPPWLGEARWRGEDKNDLDIIMASPHPFIEDPFGDGLPRGIAPPGQEIVIYDLRALNEVVEWNPEAYKLTKFDASIPDLRAAGISDNFIDAKRSRLSRAEIRKATKLEKLVEEAARDRKWFNDLVLDGSLPEVTNATKSISDDRAHGDHSKLPAIPGLFIPDQDGTKPKVRVVTQP